MSDLLPDVSETLDLEGELLRPEALSTTHTLCTMFGALKTP